MPELSVFNFGDGVWAYAFDDQPTNSVGADLATGLGGKALLGATNFLVLHKSKLVGITDVGDGVIPTSQQLAAIHSHPYQNFLDSIVPPTVAQNGYGLLASGGQAVWSQLQLGGNGVQIYADLAALVADKPAGPGAGESNYHILLNGAGPASFGVWDSNPPAAWVDTGASTGILSVNGLTTPALLLDTDDIPEGATNLYVTAADRTIIRTTVAANTAAITQNATDIANRLLISTFNASPAAFVTSDMLTALAQILATGAVGTVLKRTGTGALDFQWNPEDAAGPGGDVDSVNGQTPVNGDVTIDTSHVDPVAARGYVTPTVAADLSEAKTNAASAVNKIARMRKRQTLTIDSGQTDWDLDLGLNARLTLNADTELQLPTNFDIDPGNSEVLDRTLELTVYPDGVSQLTFATGFFYFPDGEEYVASSDPTSFDVISIKPDTATKLAVAEIKTFKLPP